MRVEMLGMVKGNSRSPQAAKVAGKGRMLRIASFREGFEASIGSVAAMTVCIGYMRDISIHTLMFGVTSSTADILLSFAARLREVVRVKASAFETMALAAKRRHILILNQRLRQEEALTCMTFMTETAPLSINQIGMSGGERAGYCEVLIKAEKAR